MTVDRRTRTGLSKPGSHVSVVRVDRPDFTGNVVSLFPHSSPQYRDLFHRKPGVFTQPSHRAGPPVKRLHDPRHAGPRSDPPATSTSLYPSDVGVPVSTGYRHARRLRVEDVRDQSRKYETEPARTSFTGNPVCLHPSATRPVDGSVARRPGCDPGNRLSASVSDGTYRSTTPSAVTTVEAVGSSSSVSSTTSTAHSSLTDPIPSKTCSGTSGIGTGTYAFARMAATPS